LSDSGRLPRVFMMDLWATVPYYTAYLSKALLAEGVPLQVGSITYYLDTKCFSCRGIKLDPGLMDVVGRYDMPRVPRRLLKLLEAMLNLVALCVRFAVQPPDVVHVQYLPMLRWRVPVDLWFLEFCRWRGAKIVLTVHDLLPHDTAKAYQRTFDELYAMVDAIICHSDHIKTRLRDEFHVDEEKVSVIPHGPFFYDLPETKDVETARAFGVQEGQTLVLWQGIIFPYKGVDLLLDAWQKVEAAGDSACLVIAGTGPDELLETIRAQVQRLGLQQVKLHFRFISTEELVAMYRQADVVVYPYRAITTSGALATGLALGKTILASDLPVFRELLTNGENALLVDPSHANALAGALTRLIRDAELREALAAKVRAMRFGDESWLSIAQKTALVYKDLLAPGKSV
jgi:glycosyltransferase involved in cell wall biosynthesis